ncbi:hypothetical protein CAEBREN_11703 [Caenorhabditis brenneri]|uniref:Uncharacterized protein n=1 Tax=Caenorhabditis brenneri TaxID=135651 RepID=G0P0B2_CAEBE|nr:hypothetical protein CAEBREN_11703 [Caenorhabditis brenneri]
MYKYMYIFLNVQVLKHEIPKFPIWHFSAGRLIFQYYSSIGFLAPQFPITILDLYEPSFINHFRIHCYEQYTRFQLCIPDYERCRNSRPNPLECKNIFLNCTKNGPVHEYNEFCNAYLLNESNQLTTEEDWHKNLNESLTISEDNCHISDVFFKTRIPNITNVIIEIMPSIVSVFCPCGKKWNDESEGIRSSMMGIPLHMWHGGFNSKKCWREMDRFLVESLCGISVALEVNHVWASKSDCLEGPGPRKNCLNTFKSSLKNTVNNSTIPNKCQLYYDVVGAYFPSLYHPSFDYNISFINASDLIYLRSFEFQNDRLYLMSSFGESVYFTCFSSKREVSSSIFMYEYCEEHEKSEKCGEKLIDRLSGVKEECRNLLVSKVDHIEMIDKIFKYLMDNCLLLAWPVILYILKWPVISLFKLSVVSFLIWFFLKLSGRLDNWSDRIEGEPTKNRNRSPESQKPAGLNLQRDLESKPNETDPLTEEGGSRDIPSGEKFKGNKNAIDNNNGTSEDASANQNEGVVNKENKEEEKKEEKKKDSLWKKSWKSLDDSPVGRSFKKLCFSIGRFVSAVFNKFFRSQ